MIYCFLLVFLSFHHALQAYTDPGTGAMIWQLLMAAGVGFLFYARTFFNWIRTFGRKKNKLEDSNTQK